MRDTVYLANDDNKRALAYIVGNSVCTVDTREGDDGDDKQGTLNYLKPEMIEALDDGLSDTPDEPALPDTTDTSASAESISN